MTRSAGVIDLLFFKAGEVQDGAVPWQSSPACSLSTGHCCAPAAVSLPVPCAGDEGGPGARLAAGLRQGRAFPHLPPNLTVANMEPLCPWQGCGAGSPPAGSAGSCWRAQDTQAHFPLTLLWFQ